jgi:hypothetical protein
MLLYLYIIIILHNNNPTLWGWQKAFQKMAEQRSK